MKQKPKFVKKKSYNALLPSAPRLETLQINSIKTRKGYMASSANIILAFNMIFLMICVSYIGYYLLDISQYLIQCETHCLISALNVLCCLNYILSSSYLIIAIKNTKFEYYKKYNIMIGLICLMQFIKGVIYFIIHEIIDENNCIFDFINYEGTIMVCIVIICIAILFVYFIRKLRIYVEGKFTFIHYR